MVRAQARRASLAMGLALALGGLAALLGAMLDADFGPAAPIALGASPSQTQIFVHNSKHNNVTTIEAGVQVHAFAQVTGPLAGPVVVQGWSNDLCKGTAAITANAGLSNGQVDVPASALNPMAPGFASYRATFTGSATHLPSQSVCLKVTITKATPTLTAKLHDVNHNVVTEVWSTTEAHDNIKLTGAAGIPNGEVVVKIYGGGTCSTGSPTVTNYLAPDSGILETDPIDGAARTVSFQATYQGNAIYKSRVGPCQALTFVNFTPVVQLTVHRADHSAVNGPALVGEILHPRIEQGGPIGVVSGRFTFLVYDTANCTGDLLDSGLSTIPDDGILDNPATFNDSVALAGGHSWKARWTPRSHGLGYDAAFSDCVTVRWKAPSTMVAETHDLTHDEVGAILAATPLHVRVSIAGPASSAASGDLTIRLFRGSGCSTAAGSFTVRMTGGLYDASTPTLAPTGAGAYSLRVEYSGNSRYAAVDGDCKLLSVTKRTATITGDPNDAGNDGVTSAALGAPIHLRARVFDSEDGPDPTGLIIAYYFANGGCTGSPLAASARTELSGGVARLKDFAQTPATPGTYAFRYDYSGDAAYLGGSSPCLSYVVLAPDATPPPAPTAPPTLAPGATPTAPPLSAFESPDPNASPAPGTSLDPNATAAPVTSLAPGETLGPGQTLAPGQSIPVGSSGSPSAPGASGASGASGLFPLLVIGLVLVGVLAAGSFLLGRRSNSGS